MRKIGIVTIFDSRNYGNRLQNAAVQYILQTRGFQPETIVCRKSRFWYDVHIWGTFIKSKFCRKPDALRIASFYRFNRKHLKVRRIYNKANLIPSALRNEYEYFVAGSDQIWNYSFLSTPILNLYFLDFAADNQKVCISPSIGISAVDDEHRPLFSEKLSGFKYLSCREKNGAEELARITGRECRWLIDPTLYLTRDEWRTILSIARQEEEPYIFVFFLDGISEELNQFIREYAADRYKIIDPSFPESSYYSIDPEQFIMYLSNASLVFTDSFHVVAFSINFHIPFYVFNRKKVLNMSSRIASLCELFHLEERYIPQQKPFALLDACSFEPADRQLALERKKFSDYLDECFKE